MDGRQRLYGDRVRRHHRRMKPTAAVVFATAVLGATAIAAEIPLADRKSGYEFMGRETRAMQDDDTANPGMLSVLDGEALWNRKVGAANKSCADCHHDAGASMKGVAARYPAFSPALGRPIDIEQRINMWRARGLKLESPAVRP